jgi:hypothetical protein
VNPQAGGWLEQIQGRIAGRYFRILHDATISIARITLSDAIEGATGGIPRQKQSAGSSTCHRW